MGEQLQRAMDRDLRRWAVKRAQAHGPRDGAGRLDPAKVVEYAKELEAYVRGDSG